MEYNVIKLKEGIKLHTIKTDKFKTNLVALFLSTKLERKNVTKNALISMILRRGSKNMISQEEISKKMEDMYMMKYLKVYFLMFISIKMKIITLLKQIMIKQMIKLRIDMMLKINQLMLKVKQYIWDTTQLMIMKGK